MKRRTLPLLLLLPCLMMSAAVFAGDDEPLCAASGVGSDCLPLIARFMQKLGARLGFNLLAPLPTETIRESIALIDFDNAQKNQQALIQTQVGAQTIATLTPEGGSGPLLYKYVASLPLNAFLNSRLNTTFTKTTPSTGPNRQVISSAAQNSNLDQKPYQADPVTQVLLNLVATPPDGTGCPDYDPSKYDDTKSASDNPALPNCFNVTEVLKTTTPLPKPLTDYFDLKKNDLLALLPFLNNDTLITPLLISTDTQSASDSSTIDQASVFIRYASGTIVPPDLPDYNTLKNIQNAKKEPYLQKFITEMRIYTAQASVGLSNLYYILSKRLPQKIESGEPTSQALSEYKMATWRLYDTTEDNAGKKEPNKQWLNELNTANATTLQKEMVTLLAEINYQLYLNRQQQERLLVTNSVLLLMAARSTKPDLSALQSRITSSSGTH